MGAGAWVCVCVSSRGCAWVWSNKGVHLRLCARAHACVSVWLCMCTSMVVGAGMYPNITLKENKVK